MSLRVDERSVSFGVQAGTVGDSVRMRWAVMVLEEDGEPFCQCFGDTEAEARQRAESVAAQVF